MKRAFRWFLIPSIAVFIPVFVGAVGNDSYCIRNMSNPDLEFLNLFLPSQNATGRFSQNATWSWQYRDCVGGIGGNATNGTVVTCSFVPDKVVYVSGKKLMVQEREDCGGKFKVMLDFLNQWGRTSLKDDPGFKFQGSLEPSPPCTCQ